METSLANHPPTPEVILKLIKDALFGCHLSSSRLCGFARGLEIGISTLRQSQSTTSDPINRLQERSLRLSESYDDYDLGVFLGIDLARMIAARMLD